MERDRRSSTIRVPELLVSASLVYFDEPQSFENRYHFLRFEDRHGYRLIHIDSLYSDKLRFQRRFALFK